MEAARRPPGTRAVSRLIASNARAQLAAGPAPSGAQMPYPLVPGTSMMRSASSAVAVSGAVRAPEPGQLLTATVTATPPHNQPIGLTATTLHVEVEASELGAVPDKEVVTRTSPRASSCPGQAMTTLHESAVSPLLALRAGGVVVAVP